MPLRQEEDLGFLLARVYRAMRRRLVSELEPLGVTYEQYRVLIALCEQDYVAQVILATSVAADKTSLARMLSRMEGAGLASRETDPDDSRVQRVQRTEKGREMQGQVILRRDRALGTAFQGLSGEAVRELKRMLNRIYGNTRQARRWVGP